MVKPLTFKGDKKSKKRKHHELSSDDVQSQNVAQIGTDEDESWTTPAEPSNLAGPILFVLPTVPPTCLASDTLGNVFASPLENMVEKDPKTAEPHDVRQVWVASRVPGMGKGEYSFKGSHGGYLSCDQYGILGAKREARGREESFTVEVESSETSTFRWHLRTAASKSSTKSEDGRYLCAMTDTPRTAGNRSSNVDHDESDGKSQKVSISLRGDGDISSENTYIIFRMQSRFLPQTEATKEAARVKEKVGRRELEAAVGRSLTEDEVKKLRRAKREGMYHEEILDLRAKGKHDKFA